jgi:hypothetical protein
MLFPLVLAACGPSPALQDPETPSVEIAEAPHRAPLARKADQGYRPHATGRIAAGNAFRGHYFCPQGDTQMTLHIEEVLRNGQVRGVFSFHHEATEAQGSFSVEGRMASDGEVTFEPVEWITRPPRYVAIPFRLVFSEDGKQARGGVLHPSCGAMEASLVSP